MPSVTANSNRSRIAAVGIVAGLLVLSSQQPVLAQETTEKQERAERHELPPLTATVSPEEALAAIKRRAQKIIEARRAARRLKIYVEGSEIYAYETNPSNAGNPTKGDSSFEEDVYLLLSKKLTPTIEWQGSYSGVYLKYLDYGDGDYTSHTLTPVKLVWRPGRMWRAETWMDLDYNYYPVAGDSSYRQIKWTGRLRQNLFGSAFHQFQYEWFDRHYTHKRARDGAGNNTLTRRDDVRNRLRYKVGATVKKALMTVENEYYWNDSNDAKNAFYDYQVWKITGSASGNVTPKLYVSQSLAYEQKNYEHRAVSGITAEARYDGKYTLSSSVSYDLNKTWKIGYDFTYDHLDSNEPTGEFDNAKHAVKVTAHF